MYGLIFKPQFINSLTILSFDSLRVLGDTERINRPKTQIMKINEIEVSFKYALIWNTSHSQCKFEHPSELALRENYFHIEKNIGYLFPDVPFLVNSIRPLRLEWQSQDFTLSTRVHCTSGTHSTSYWIPEIVERLGTKVIAHSIQCPAENEWRYTSTSTHLLMAEFSTGAIFLTKVQCGQ